jgi:hypothetical protein
VRRRRRLRGRRTAAAREARAEGGVAFHSARYEPFGINLGSLELATNIRWNMLVE